MGRIYLESFCFAVNSLLTESDKVQKRAREEIQALALPVENQTPRQMYLRLLRDTVAGISLAGSEQSLIPDPENPEILNRIPLNMNLRKLGQDWPCLGMTAIGINRLNNVLESIFTIAADDVPGRY